MKRQALNFFAIVLSAGIVLSVVYFLFPSRLTKAFQSGRDVFTNTACQEYDLSGYAWSSNVGWISFSCKNQDAGVNYGVDVDVDGLLSGYAWSSSVGWISFNKNDLSGCPSGACEARRADDQVVGWARAYRAINPESQTLGGWDGWIKLSGVAQNLASYGISVGPLENNACEWSGYAWGGDNDLNEAVVGWINFKGPAYYGVQGKGDACFSGTTLYGLEVIRSGAGTGTVANQPMGESSCGIGCKTYIANTPVALTAAASAGSKVSSWSGDCDSSSINADGSSGTCAVTMNNPKFVTVTFDIVSSPLQVSCSGSPASAAINQTVKWTASASGGTGSYNYSWRGDGFDGSEGNVASVNKSYSSSGNKSASVTVASGSQKAENQNCGQIAITDLNCVFSANPAWLIYANQKSTLSWTCQNVNPNNCSINPGNLSAPVDLNGKGSQEVSVPQTTTYNLSCEHKNDSSIKGLWQTIVNVLFSQIIEVPPR